MKIIITESQLYNLISEKRKYHNTNVDPSFNQYLNNLLSNFNVDDVFVSFRDNIYVTDINPINIYNTPTGVYTYPLKSFKKYITNDIDEEKFRNLFPYKNQEPFIVFFIINNEFNDNILNSKTPKSKLNSFTRNIIKLYQNNKPVVNLCDKFINNKYKPIGYQTLHNTHNFWRLIHDIIPLLDNSNIKNKKTKITNLCNKINVFGFEDFNGDGFIHPDEPTQAVFFRFKGIGQSFYYSKINPTSRKKTHLFSKLDDSKGDFTNIFNLISSYISEINGATLDIALKKLTNQSHKNKLIFSLLNNENARDRYHNDVVEVSIDHLEPNQIKNYVENITHNFKPYLFTVYNVDGILNKSPINQKDDIIYFLLNDMSQNITNHFEMKNYIEKIILLSKKHISNKKQFNSFINNKFNI